MAARKLRSRVKAALFRNENAWPSPISPASDALRHRAFRGKVGGRQGLAPFLQRIQCENCNVWRAPRRYVICPFHQTRLKPSAARRN